MLSESSSHRQQRLEREPERFAVKGLHCFDVVGEDSDVYLWPRKVHVNLPPEGDARAYRASQRKSNAAGSRQVKQEDLSIGLGADGNSRFTLNRRAVARPHRRTVQGNDATRHLQPGTAARSKVAYHPLTRCQIGDK